MTLTSAGAPVGASIGTYDITPSVALGTGLANYTITYVVGTLTVDPRALEIRAFSTSKVYGALVTFTGLVPEFSITGGTLVGSDSVDSVTLTSAGAPVGASIGTYDITPSVALGTGLANYTITYVVGTLTVDPRALEITAFSTSKVYGALVTFTGVSPEFSITGGTLVGSDTIASATLTSTGAPPSAGVVGSPYPIVASAAVGGGATLVDNYTISYLDGALTVTPLALTFSITANDKAYDGNTSATLSAGPSLVGPVVGGDDVSVAVGGSSTTTFPAKNAGPGKTVTQTELSLTGVDAGNYTVPGTTATDIANITPGSVTITADDKTKVFDGSPYSPFTVTYAGFVSGEAPPDLNGALTIAGTAVGAIPGGIYTIEPGGFTSSNYFIAYVNGTLTITNLGIAKAVTGNLDQDSSGTVTLGDTLIYTVTATNIGGSALTNVVVTDPLLTPTGGTAPCATVAPGGATCVLVGTYQVTAGDVTAGKVVNTATTDSDETPPVLVTHEEPVAGLSVVKVLLGTIDADLSLSVSLGDTLNYMITATNTGGTLLSNVVASET